MPSNRPISIHRLAIALGVGLTVLGTWMDWIVQSPTFDGPAGWGGGWAHLHNTGIESFDWMILLVVGVGVIASLVISHRRYGDFVLAICGVVALALSTKVLVDELNPSLLVFLRLNLEGVKQVPGLGFYLTLIGELILVIAGSIGFVKTVSINLNHR